VHSPARAARRKPPSAAALIYAPVPRPARFRRAPRLAHARNARDRPRAATRAVCAARAAGAARQGARPDAANATTPPRRRQRMGRDVRPSRPVVARAATPPGRGTVVVGRGPRSTRPHIHTRGGLRRSTERRADASASTVGIRRLGGPASAAISLACVCCTPTSPPPSHPLHRGGGLCPP